MLPFVTRPIAARLFLFGFAVFSSVAHASTWQFDAQKTNIYFTLNLFGSLEKKGEFKRFTGSVNYHPKVAAKNSLSMRIDTKSLKIDLPKKLAKLGEGDLFNTKKHPYMHFASDKVTFLKSPSKSAKRGIISGKLSFMGKKRLAHFKVTYRELTPKGASTPSRILFRASASIKRSSYGIKLPALSGVADDIPISVSGVLVPAK